MVFLHIRNRDSTRRKTFFVEEKQVCECGQVLDGENRCPDCGRQYQIKDNEITEVKEDGRSENSVPRPAEAV